MSEGLTAVSSVMTFFASDSTFKVLIGVAVAGVVISMVLGLFFRK